MRVVCESGLAGIWISGCTEKTLISWVREEESKHGPGAPRKYCLGSYSKFLSAILLPSSTLRRVILIQNLLWLLGGNCSCREREKVWALSIPVVSDTTKPLVLTIYAYSGRKGYCFSGQGSQITWLSHWVAWLQTGCPIRATGQLCPDCHGMRCSLVGEEWGWQVSSCPKGVSTHWISFVSHLCKSLLPAESWSPLEKWGAGSEDNKVMHNVHNVTWPLWWLSKVGQQEFVPFRWNTWVRKLKVTWPGSGITSPIDFKCQVYSTGAFRNNSKARVIWVDICWLIGLFDYKEQRLYSTPRVAGCDHKLSIVWWHM